MRFLILVLIAGLGYAAFVFLTTDPVEGDWVVHPALTQSKDKNWYKHPEKLQEEIRKGILQVDSTHWVLTLGKRQIKRTYELGEKNKRGCYPIKFDGKPLRKWPDQACFREDVMFYHRRTKKPRFVLALVRAN